MTLPLLLVVDDERDVGEFVCDVARSVGFEAMPADHPKTFKELYRDDLKVIVLDLVLPEVDGVEILRFLSDKGCRASLILVSGFDGHVLRSARELAIARGLWVVGSLAKPIRCETLETILRRVLEPPEKTARDEGEVPAVADLREAIARREQIVFFQPKVTMANRRPVGAEALVRWRHPERGLIPPSEFIPLAEEMGLIDDLTTIVFELAVAQCRRWRDAGFSMRIAVNISAESLTNLDLPEQFSVLARENQIDPSQVIIELTESALAKEETVSLDILARLRMEGFQLSIDDFGTGFSELRQLRKVPFNEMKIDQCFISHADSDEESRSIIETMIALGHKLGMTVVAEGVETEPVWNLLAELGCDLGQGYLISKPLPADEFLTWLRACPQAASDQSGPGRENHPGQLLAHSPVGVSTSSAMNDYHGALSKFRRA